MILAERLGHIPGEEADCTNDQVCTREGCGAILTERLGHVPGAAATCTEAQTCATCGVVLAEKLGHKPGAEATCTEAQTCETCGVVLAEKLGHISGPEATCTNDQLCTREGCGEILADRLGHSWSGWITNGDGTHTRTCHNDTKHTETKACTGGTAICTSGPICDVCEGEYGDIDLTVDGHDYILDKTVPATCLETGLMRYICQVEDCPDPVREIVLEAIGQHLYRNWELAGDGTHKATCYTCGDSLAVPCTVYKAGEFTVCPVCGEIEGGVMPVLLAKAHEALPIGTLIVRGMANPFEDVLYAFTAAAVYGGEVVNIHGDVEITLPIELDSFRVVRVDIIGGEEIRTDVAFSLAGGKLTITTETSGLFLLVPAEQLKMSGEQTLVCSPNERRRCGKCLRRKSKPTASMATRLT